mmetsp:Transcript_68082/g.154046  ORF Transcript_68082/g.154046 Transcript_68082/m.154046 type:complete len:215 (-) Transcript_68082:323-967(-)
MHAHWQSLVLSSMSSCMLGWRLKSMAMAPLTTESRLARSFVWLTSFPNKVALGQPKFFSAQQNSFCFFDQSFSQVDVLAAQSYSQPTSWCSQHQLFFGLVQPSFQSLTPAEQLNVPQPLPAMSQQKNCWPRSHFFSQSSESFWQSYLHARSWYLQHQSFFVSAQPAFQLLRPAVQLLLPHPRPSVLQQYSAFSDVQLACQWVKLASQSKPQPTS